MHLTHWKKAILLSLMEKRPKDASYRLFGKKYDSLPTLLDRLTVSEEGDDVERYVIIMCATQLVKELEAAFPAFWSENPEDAAALSRKIADLGHTIRQTLVVRASDSMEDFLKWFDRWFIERAEPVEMQRD